MIQEDPDSLRRRMNDRARYVQRLVEDPNDFDARRKIKDIDDQVGERECDLLQQVE